MKIQCLLYMVLDDFPICCPECKRALTPDDDLRWDHRHAIGLGGDDNYTNLRPLHRACHDRKTFGTKATTAGSDIQRIAKVKRIASGGKKRRGRKIPSRPFPAGRKFRTK